MTTKKFSARVLPDGPPRGAPALCTERCSTARQQRTDMLILQLESGWRLWHPAVNIGVVKNHKLPRDDLNYLLSSSSYKKKTTKGHIVTRSLEAIQRQGFHPAHWAQLWELWQPQLWLDVHSAVHVSLGTYLHSSHVQAYTSTNCDRRRTDIGKFYFKSSTQVCQFNSNSVKNKGSLHCQLHAPL